MLLRWADWNLDARQIEMLTKPYRAGLSAAFAGFLHDDPEPIIKFARLRTRYEPILRLLSRATDYADKCGELPTGVQGLIARLTTPSAGALFAAERYTSFAVETIDSAGGESEDTLITALSARLQRSAR